MTVWKSLEKNKIICDTVQRQAYSDDLTHFLDTNDTNEVFRGDINRKTSDGCIIGHKVTWSSCDYSQLGQGSLEIGHGVGDCGSPDLALFWEEELQWG